MQKIKTSPRLADKSWLFWLVQKYLQSRSRVHAGSSLWLAVAGIMIGVATLIAVLTGMNGLQSLLTDSIDEVTAYHLQVLVKNKKDSLLLEKYLQDNRAIKNVTRYREAPMLLNTEYGEPVVSLVRAVDVAGFMADKRRQAVMQTLGPVHKNDLQQGERMWVGRAFLYQYGFAEGDRLQVISAEYSKGSIAAKQYDFLISAAYRLGNPSIEKNYIFIGLNPQTAPLFYSDEYYLGLKLQKQNLAAKFQRQLGPQLQALRAAGEISSYQVRTGRAANRAFFNALRTEKSFLQLLVSLIFVVVAFQIFQSTRRTVYARIPELMLLRALGASAADIRSIFLWESLFVGLLGTLLGTLLGALISRYINEILAFISRSLFRFPSLMPNISTYIFWQDLLVVAGSALVFSSAAGWLATRRLLHIQPIEVLRHE